MTIVLTKTINGKKVPLDLISLGGKTVVRYASLVEAKAQGITEENITDLGINIQKSATDINIATIEK